MTALRSRGGIQYTSAPRSGIGRGIKDIILAGLDGAVNLALIREDRKIRGDYPNGHVESSVPTPTIRDRDPVDPPQSSNFAQYMPILLLGVGAYFIAR